MFKRVDPKYGSPIIRAEAKWLIIARDENAYHDYHTTAERRMVDEHLAKLEEQAEEEVREALENQEIPVFTFVHDDSKATAEVNKTVPTIDTQFNLKDYLNKISKTGNITGANFIPTRFSETKTVENASPQTIFKDVITLTSAFKSAEDTEGYSEESYDNEPCLIPYDIAFSGGLRIIYVTKNGRAFTLEERKQLLEEAKQRFFHLAKYSGVMYMEMDLDGEKSLWYSEDCYNECELF